MDENIKSLPAGYTLKQTNSLSTVGSTYVLFEAQCIVTKLTRRKKRFTGILALQAEKAAHWIRRFDAGLEPKYEVDQARQEQSEQHTMQRFLSPAEQATRDAAIFAAVCGGETQTAVAQRYQIPQPSVSHIVKKYTALGEQHNTRQENAHAKKLHV